MTRTMYDGISALALPVGARLYAGYVDGRWPDADAISQRFVLATVVRIATSPATDDGVVGDGPPDNGCWPLWVAWVVRRRAAGVDPTMYTNASSWSAGIQAFKQAAVAQPHWWIADYDGDPTIPAGAVAKQYASNDAYDTSSVADYWPGVDPEPKPAAAAAPDLEENSMQIEPTSVHKGDYAAVIPSGVGQLVLVADGTGAGPAKLKITLWNNDKPTVLPDVEIGGSSGHHVLGHALAGADALTVLRLDGEAFAVAAGFRA